LIYYQSIIVLLVFLVFYFLKMSSGLAQELDDATHLVGDAYLLRALGQAGLAIDTLVGSGIVPTCC